ncbi:hypothetical protein ACIQCD_20255 [Streptomyces sp. NPDC093250]|uniref:hypothetical protein n=1 Tax=Streptomyces sp. NPDC093250 TaxID=3366036 RepID=UPI0037F373AA
MTRTSESSRLIIGGGTVASLGNNTPATGVRCIHFRSLTPNALMVRGAPTLTGGTQILMENPPGETDPPCDLPPYSMRELDSIYLALSMASSAMEEKQILSWYGLTTEDARELFRGCPGFIGPTDADDSDAHDD